MQQVKGRQQNEGAINLPSPTWKERLTPAKLPSPSD